MEQPTSHKRINNFKQGILEYGQFRGKFTESLSQIHRDFKSLYSTGP